MKKIILLLSILLLSTTIKAENFTHAELIEVIDGDTVRVNILCIHHPIFGERILVRLKDINAPEVRTRNLVEKAKGFKSKSYLQKLLSINKGFKLLNCTRGKYFRIVCILQNDIFENISKEMIKANHAVYKKY